MHTAVRQSNSKTQIAFELDVYVPIAIPASTMPTKYCVQYNKNTWPTKKGLSWHLDANHRSKYM